MEVLFEESYVNFLIFEDVLKKFFKNSFNKKTVKFNFEVVEYIALPQMCYLFGWIEMLLKQQIDVELKFKSSSDSKIYNVIKRYGFFTNLHKYDKKLIISKPYLEKVKPDKKSLKQDTPLVNLSSFDNEKFYDHFLRKLYTKNLSIFAEDNLDEKSIIDRTGTRDIFLKELGKNVFDHSGGAPAIIAVSKKSKEHLQLASNPQAIKNYANETDSDEFIEVVVTDLGDGIPKVIKQVFKQDTEAHRVLNPNSEVSFIEYAFWKDTSSKRERASDRYIEIIESGELVKHFIAPTGLYFVKQLAFENKGFLYCRSGRSIIAWDFSQDNYNKLNASIWRDKKILEGKYENIKGNIFCLILPVKQSLEELSSEKGKKIKKSIVPLSSKYINLNEIVSKHDDETEKVYSIIKEIEKQCRILPQNVAMLIDCPPVELQSRSLFWILIFCMYWSDKNRSIVINDYYQNRTLQLVKKQIRDVIIDYRKVSLLPIQYFSSIDTLSEKISVSYSKKHPQMSIVDENWILDELYKHRKIIVKKILLSSFKEDEQVYLPGPSEGFLLGYFELADVLSNDLLNYLIASLIYYKLNDKKFSAIILTTNILDKIAIYLSYFLSLKINKIFVPKNEASLSKIALTAKKDNGSILIISDVNVTFKTVAYYAELMRNPISIATLIDGKCEKLPSINNLSQYYPIISYNLKLYDTKPPKWPYSEIRLVDPITHKILYERRSTQKTIWEDEIVYSYLQDWTSSKGYVRPGHFCYGFSCYLYFFHMDSIAKDHKQEISLDIIENVKKTVEIAKEQKTKMGERTTDLSDITYIIYPQENIAAEMVCNEISTYLGGEVIYLPRFTNDRAGTSYTQNPYVKDKIKNGILIFFDTAATTTKTIRNILQLAGDLGADLALVYILINRVSDDWPSFVDGIDKFRGCEIQIKSFMKLGLPVHTSSSCTLCKLLETIDNAFLAFIPNNCRIVLNSFADKFKPIHIEDVREWDILEDNKDIIAKQIEFRDSLELTTNMIKLSDKKQLADYFKHAETDKKLREAIMAALSLELEFFLRNQRYKRIFDSTFIAKVEKLGYMSIFNDNESESSICNAIRICSRLNFNMFLQKLSKRKIKVITNDIVETIIVCFFIYHNKTTIEKCSKVSELLHKTVESFNIDNNFSAALAEAAFYFRYQTSQTELKQTDYLTAYNTLLGIYEQLDRSHTEMQSMFSDLEQIVSKEDVIYIVEKVYKGKKGFRSVMLNSIIPAIKKVTSAWPESFNSELIYCQNDLIQDLLDLDTILIRCYNKIIIKNLDNKNWINEKNRIYDILKRLSDNLFNSTDSMLRIKLEDAQCTYESVINECLTELKNKIKKEIIVIRVLGNGVSETSTIPRFHLNDVFSTMLENISKYSKPNTTSIVQVSRKKKQIEISFKSTPKKGFIIEKRTNRGIHRAEVIMARYGAEIEIINPHKKVRDAIVKIKIFS